MNKGHTNQPQKDTKQDYKRRITTTEMKITTEMENNDKETKKDQKETQTDL